jgi:cell division protein FtsQ
VWQSHGRTVVLDADGQIVKEADPAKFPELPLIVGEGADSAAADILGEVAQRAKLKGRVEALVRVDGRRWDLRLKDGCIIQLPSTDEGAALIRLDQLDERQRILDLGFERIDLRVPDMISVRPRGSGVPAQIQPVAGGV